MVDLNFIIILMLCFVIAYLCYVVNRQHKEINRIKETHDTNALNFYKSMQDQIQAHNALCETVKNLASSSLDLANAFSNYLDDK